LTQTLVQWNNGLCKRLATLMQVCNMLGLQQIMEQPISSALWEVKGMVELTKQFKEQYIWRKCTVHLGAFGAETAKPVSLRGTPPQDTTTTSKHPAPGTAPWIPELACKAPVNFVSKNNIVNRKAKQAPMLIRKSQ
jgi:hypothetical protein